MITERFLQKLRSKLIKLECLSAAECGHESLIAKTEVQRYKIMAFVEREIMLSEVAAKAEGRKEGM